jgi:hypothetical protein
MGVLYIVESHGYHDSIDGSTTREGRVAHPVDTDGDGKYDERSEFFTGLTQPARRDERRHPRLTGRATTTTRRTYQFATARDFI